MWTLWRKAGESSSIERILDICLAGGPDDLWSNSPALWEPPILYKTGGGTRPSAFIEANPTSLQIRMIYVMGLQGRQRTSCMDRGSWSCRAYKRQVDQAAFHKKLPSKRCTSRSCLPVKAAVRPNSPSQGWRRYPRRYCRRFVQQRSNHIS